MKRLVNYIEIMAAVAVFFILLIASFSIKADPAMPPMDNNGMPNMGGNGLSGVNNANRGNISQIGLYNESASNSNATGIAPNGVNITNNVPGGNPGAVATGVQGGVGNDNSSGSTAQLRLNNVGSSNFRYPVQPPPILGYGSYSQASCMGSFGASGSGGAGGGGLLLPWESDDCNYRLNSAHMAALGKPKTACYIMTDNIDYVGEANSKAPDEACSKVISTSIAMPVPGAIINQQTPTLDNYDPSQFVTKPELRQQLDNAHRLGVIK